MNPVNSSGNITKCSICQSIYHWFRDCPYEVDDTSTQVKLSLFTDEVYNCYINKFVGETLNHAVLDSGCTKTVCGASWLDSYIETLSECNRKKIVQSKSETKFKFGDGKTVSSLKSVIVPAQIGKREVSIKADVIDNELLLLLNKEAMKMVETKIDFTKDKINILGQEMDIKFTSSGHYSIPISKTSKALNEFDQNQSNNIFLSIDNMSKKTVSEK